MDTQDPQTPATIPQVSEEDRYKSPYPRWEQVARLGWAIVERTLFRCSFPTWYGYRAALLRLFGAKVGANSRIRRTVHFECPWNFSCGENCALGDHSIIYALGRVTLHNRVCLSQYAHLCAGSHDLTKKALPLLRPPITLKDDAWLLADSFVGPSVTLHEGALLGARSSAFRDLEPWSINVGSPAKKIKDRPRIDLL